MISRAGPQSQKWSDQQIMLNPTWSIHKKARKKVDFDLIGGLHLKKMARAQGKMR